MKRLLMSAAVFCGSMFAATVPQTGQLTISVKDYLGTPVPGAFVTLSPRAMAASEQTLPVLPSYNGRATANALGVVSLTSVPVGAYVYCASDLSGKLLDSCAWVDDPGTILVKSGQTTSASITLQRGVQVTVQVNDPGSLLSSVQAAGVPLRIILSTLRGQYTPLRLTQKSSGSVQYSVLAPANAHLKFQVSSTRYRVSDSHGAALDPKNPKGPLQLLTGDAASAVSVQFTLGAL